MWKCAPKKTLTPNLLNFSLWTVFKIYWVELEWIIYLESISQTTDRNIFPEEEDTNKI